MSSIKSSEFKPSQHVLRGLYVSIMHSMLSNTHLPTEIRDEYLAGVRSLLQTTVLGGYAVAAVNAEHDRAEFDEIAVKIPLAMHGTSDPNWVHITLQNSADAEKPSRGLTYALHREVDTTTTELYRYQVYKYLPGFDVDVDVENERPNEDDRATRLLDIYEEEMYAVTPADMALLGRLATELARGPE